MRRTTTALPRVSPIMQPMNSVGYERYWSARKRRAWSDRISFRTIGPRVVPPALRAHAESTSRADSGCRASNAVRPNAATAMRTIRLRPSLTTSLDRVCRPDYLPRSEEHTSELQSHSDLVWHL